MKSSNVSISFPGGSAGKESACNKGDLGLIPGLGRSPGEGKGYLLQYSSLENSMYYIVHGVTKSQTQLSNFPFHFQGFLVPQHLGQPASPTLFCFFIPLPHPVHLTLSWLTAWTMFPHASGPLHMQPSLPKTLVPYFFFFHPVGSFSSSNSQSKDTSLEELSLISLKRKGWMLVSCITCIWTSGLTMS